MKERPRSGERSVTACGNPHAFPGLTALSARLSTRSNPKPKASHSFALLRSSSVLPDGLRSSSVSFNAPQRT